MEEELTRIDIAIVPIPHLIYNLRQNRHFDPKFLKAKGLMIFFGPVSFAIRRGQSSDKNDDKMFLIAKESINLAHG
jgi:hypothetical protein